MKILITGFESQKDKSNASDILVSSLINETPKPLADFPSEIKLQVVVDDTHTLKTEVTDLIRDFGPDYCLFTGQAPGRNKITLECIATNYRYLGPPPKVGEQPIGAEIEDGGPDAYMSNIPSLESIVTDLKSEVIPAALSRWGGNSLCNQILYHGLHYAKSIGKDIKCGFVHIPALPEQVISQWPEAPFMPLSMMRRAIEVIVSNIVLQER